MDSLCGLLFGIILIPVNIVISIIGICVFVAGIVIMFAVGIIVGVGYLIKKGFDKVMSWFGKGEKSFEACTA